MCEANEGDCRCTAPARWLWTPPFDLPPVRVCDYCRGEVVRSGVGGSWERLPAPWARDDADAVFKAAFLAFLAAVLVLAAASIFGE